MPKLKLLMIDDQKMVCEAVKINLKGEEDIEFNYCCDPKKALAEASQIKPHIILQDLILGEENGLDLLKVYRSTKEIKDTPVIVLSSKEEANTKAEAFQLGANDYMVKFPEKLELVARIRYHASGYINKHARDLAFQQLVNNQKMLEHRNAFVKEMFSKYLTEDIVNNILEDPKGTKLGGEKRKVTLLMTFLRGFGKIIDTESPENVVKVLNNYLGEMTEVILEHQGTIDEFTGDSILVLFGAPHSLEFDADKAVLCALDMQRAISKVNQKNKDEGLPQIEMGLGVNTGDVVVGNIGSEKRSKYGVVGRHVNLTARVMVNNKGGEVLISQNTYDEISGRLGISDTKSVQVKGISEPITIYTVETLEKERQAG